MRERAPSVSRRPLTSLLLLGVSGCEMVEIQRIALHMVSGGEIIERDDLAIDRAKACGRWDKCKPAIE